MKNLMILFLLAGFISMNGQNGFEKAYIVTEKGDTIKGEAKLNPKKEFEVYDRIYFKDENGVQKNYRPGKIAAYGVKDDHFISLAHDGEPKFYKVLTRGAINLYMVVFETMQMNESVFEPEYYIAYPDNKKLVMVKKGKFKKQISEWIKEKPEFAEVYPDEKKFDEEKAIAVISQYNSWKAGQ